VTIQHIKLDQISDNPYQTRAFYDTSEIADIAESIRSLYDSRPAMFRGLLQIPEGRIVDPETNELIEFDSVASPYALADMVKTGRAVVQLAFGHKRFRAFQQLAFGSREHAPDDRFTEMPLYLVQANDWQMAVKAVTENSQRSAPNWFADAEAMNRFIGDFAKSHAEIAPLFRLSNKSSVSQYVRAAEALKEFQHADLLHWAQEGKLGLLHVLNLIPLLREKPIEARQWLARNLLVDEETGDSVSATWIKREVELFLPRQTQPATPSEEGAQHWYDFFMQQRAEHDGEYLFMQVGRSGAVWVTVGEDAEQIAQRIQAVMGSLKNGRGMNVPAIAIWMGSPISEARHDAMESLIGPFDGYLEPSPELGAMVTANLKTVSELRAAELEPQEPAAPEPPAQPQMSTTTNAPIPGVPAGMRWAHLPNDAAAQPTTPPPAKPAPAPRPAPPPAAPLAPLSAVPAAPQLSDEERESAAAEQMSKLFPGGNGQVIRGPWVAETTQESVSNRGAEIDLRRSLEDVANLVNTATQILDEVVASALEADMALVNHLNKSAQHTLYWFATAITNLTAEGVLEDIQAAVAESDNPEQTIRKSMMALSQSNGQREVQALNE
jgi:hypothetical protein